MFWLTIHADEIPRECAICLLCAAQKCEEG